MVIVSLNAMISRRQVVMDYSTPYAIGPQILDSIEADLRNAYFYDIKENDGFWGADAEINGREADGISLLTATLGHAGEQTLLSNRRIGQATEPLRRRSPISEVQYVCRQNPDRPECLELWRREDFYADDVIHAGGIYRLVYDRVFDFKLEYISRSTSSGGFAGSEDKAAEQMRRDGWSAIEERGLPRAVLASISIYGRDAEKTWEHEPEVFVFRRWIPLPQVHQSTHSEGQIASWDGKIEEPKVGPTPPGANRGAKDKAGSGAKAVQQGTQRPLGGGANRSNPFADALRNRAPSGGGTGVSTTFGNLFKPK
jgi:hypothetical protein